MKNENTIEFIEKLKKELRAFIGSKPVLVNLDAQMSKELSGARYDHVLVTAAIALRLCKKENINPTDAENCIIAALMHDCAKEKSHTFHEEIAAQNNALDELRRLPSSLWHAFTGPMYAQKTFGITDIGILNAIASHTTGRPGMNAVAKIVFASDYLSSPYYLQNVDPEYAFSRSLDELCLDKVTATLTYLIEKNKPVHHNSIDFYHHLIETTKSIYDPSCDT